MAVENPPLPAQPVVNPRLATLKDVALIVSGLGGFLAVLVAAIALFASLTIAPMRDEMRLMRTEMQAMRQEMQRGFEAVDAEFDAVDAEFKAVRKDLAALSERLVRLETLLEQIIGQGQAPAPPDADAE